MPVFVNGSQRILFVHIPKSGGSSVEAAFRRSGFYMHFHDHGPNKPNSINEFCLCSPQHLCADQILNIFDLAKFDQIFAIVRHPLHRFLSEFAMRNRDMVNVCAEQVESFFDVCVRGFESNSYFLDNHVRAQSEFILPSMKVFKIEDGMQSVTDFFEREHGVTLSIGKKLSSESLKIGASRELPVSDSLRDKILRFYSRDFEIFGYTE